MALNDIFIILSGVSIFAQTSQLQATWAYCGWTGVDASSTTWVGHKSAFGINGRLGHMIHIWVLDLVACSILLER